MDGMIRTGRFFEFARSLISTVNTEREEKADWDFYLHRVWDMSFEDFLKEKNRGKADQAMSTEQVEATVKDSLAILKNFTPEKG